MNYLSKILAKPEESKIPLPSQLFHADKKRKESISRLKSFKHPLFLIVHTGNDKVMKSDEASQMAKITDSGWIFDGDMEDKLTKKLNSLGVKYKIAEIPKDYQRNKSIIDDLEKASGTGNAPDEIPPDIKSDIEDKWGDISKQIQVDSPDEEEPSKEDEDKTGEPTTQVDKPSAIDDIRSIPKPYLIIVDMGDSSEKSQYINKALHSKKNADIIKKLHKLQLSQKRYLSFVCSGNDLKEVRSLLKREQIDFTISKKTIPVLSDNPFSDLDINFQEIEGVDEEKVREELNTSWNKQKEQGVDPEDDDEEYDIDYDKRKGIPPEKFKKIRKMVKPYLLLVQSKENKVEFNKFIKDKDVSSTLLRCVKYIVTKKSGIMSWIAPNNVVKTIQDHCKKFGVAYSLSEMPKDLNDKDQPFAEIKIKPETLGKINEIDLKNQLNANWIVSQQSVVKKPVLEMNSLVPLDYLRFMNPKSRQIELYLGGHPVDVGMLGIAYVLLESEEEGEHFKEKLNSLQLPEKVYEDMDVLSYLPKGFVGVSPKKINPANCLILHAKDTFKPQRKLEEKEGQIQKKLFDEIKKISGDQLDEKAIENLIQKKVEEYTKKAKEDFSGVGLAKVVDEFDKKLEDLFKKHEDDLYDLVHVQKGTELDMLHILAKDVLKADIGNVGSFVSSTRFIGTHTAHFSQDMKICILWGTLEPAGKIDTQSILTKMPFIKSIDDTYA